MANSGNWFESKTGKRFLAMMYGLGAAVVIMGALFKLMHWPFAGAMLTAGLSTEAVIFGIGAFLPIHDDPDWTLVYPELAGAAPGKKKESGNEVDRLNKMLSEAKIKQDTINNLGTGLKSLSTSVEGLKVANDASIATQTYTKKVTEATGNLDNLNKSYAVAAKSISTLGDSQKVSKDFYDTMQNVTSKLTQLNSVYESFLKQIPEIRDNLPSLLTAKKYSELRQQSHHYRAPCGALGFHDLGSCLKEIENFSLHGREAGNEKALGSEKEIDAAKELIERLFRCLENLELAIRRHLN